jgi:hypothetical protein
MIDLIQLYIKTIANKREYLSFFWDQISKFNALLLWGYLQFGLFSKYIMCLINQMMLKLDIGMKLSWELTKSFTWQTHLIIFIFKKWISSILQLPLHLLKLFQAIKRKYVFFLIIFIIKEEKYFFVLNIYIKLKYVSNS